MPVKKRAAKEREHRLTPEIVDLFVRAQSICPDGDRSDLGDAERSAYVDTLMEFRRALGIMPWMVCPTKATHPTPPEWARPGSATFESWPNAWKLRTALMRAAKN